MKPYKLYIFFSKESLRKTYKKQIFPEASQENQAKFLPSLKPTKTHTHTPSLKAMTIFF
jgi:hypothetical protein